MTHTKTADEAALRIDKWLWTARLYKTRSLAQAAVSGGKVHMGGHKVKPSRSVRVGDILVVSQGLYEKTLVVTGVSTMRVSAPQASLLYTETDESITKRQEKQQAIQTQYLPVMSKKPTKKERRQRLRVRQET